ncbi:hypothetical protein [Streptomyces sp. MNU89]|uniref:hypothetical protein n=1 Tax=Streptomyces sp. MNU89 TaxID=2560025 RepID=UPI001E3E4726|nr:hypothetical protein [Streptomyces sp. MNU89]MCC9738464.1 hypothetical protein [Streptomyces sp. MNU89]
MAVFMLQLLHGEDTVIEADVAARTPAGEIVLERFDQSGGCERVRSYRADAVSAVFRRGLTDGGGNYTWVPQPADGTWWCY